MKLFVWDLHGTLEQGNEDAVIEISNRALARFGYVERFNDLHVRRLYGLKWHQYFQALMPDASLEECYKLQAACFALANGPEGIEAIARYMRPSRHAHDVLASISAAGHAQLLISNTVPESLPIFLRALEMEKFFDSSNALAVDVHSHDARHTKSDVLELYLAGKTYDGMVVVGDSASDLDLANRFGGVGYLYAHRGLPHRSDRGRHIDDLAEILNEL